MCEIRESLEVGVCVDVKGSNKIHLESRSTSLLPNNSHFILTDLNCRCYWLIK